MAQIEKFSDLSLRILQRPNEFATRLVGVDGYGGSGKSTFAERLAKYLGTKKIIHTDDFASWDNPVDWWPRLLQQVIEPLTRGETAHWQRYDWNTKQLAEWHDTESGGVVVIEGVTATREAWRRFLTYRIWVECPRSLRLQRGLERDGQDAHALWEEWMVEEDKYVKLEKPQTYADLIIDGTSSAPNPENEFIKL